MTVRLENMGKKQFITNGIQRFREKEMIYQQAQAYEKKNGGADSSAPFGGASGDPMIDPIRERLAAAAEKLNEVSSASKTAISPAGASNKETVQQRIERNRLQAMEKLAKVGLQMR
jgi:hypothetical protein